MAVRPLTFGARFKQAGRTVEVKADRGSSQRFVVEVRSEGRKTRRRQHGSLPAALRDFASSWRARLQ